jgi:UPF0716 protein FxsA
MPLWPLFFLVLGFPVMEALMLFWLADAIGGWLFLWLLLDVVAGLALIRFERLVWGLRAIDTLRRGGNPLGALFASGRVMLAGGLLIFPGVISDAIAVLLLLMPGTWRRPPPAARPAGAPPAGPVTLEGEYQREQDPPR